MWVQITMCAAIQKEASDLRAPLESPLRFPALCGRSLPQTARGGREAVSLTTLCFWDLFLCLALPLVGRLHLREVLSTSGVGNLGLFVLTGRLRPQELSVLK